MSTTAKKKPRARPRYLPKKRLNPKQQAFVRLFTDPDSPTFGNATACAERLRYAKGKPGSAQLRVQGHRLSHHPDIIEEIFAANDRAGATPDACAEALAAGLNATEVRFVRDENGNSVSIEVPLHEIRLKAVGLLYRVYEAKARQPKQSCSCRATPITLKGLLQETQLPEAVQVAEAEPDSLRAQVAQLTPQDRSTLLSISKDVLAIAKLRRHDEHAKFDGNGTTSESGSENGASAEGAGIKSPTT